MKKWLFLLIALILVIPTWWVIAQENPTIEITGADASGLPTIVINASIVDSRNRPILGLTPADFTLGGDLEGLATIVSVENVLDDSLPFAVVLVIDTSTSMDGPPLQEAKDAANLFIQSIGANDPVAIVSFDSDARLVQDYTTDKEVLTTAINGLFVRGRTALYDGSVLGIEVAEAAPVPRRAVILLSDGAEYGGESVNGRSAALDKALELGVPVYTVGLGYGTDRSYLEELALGTNARVYESPQPEQLSEIYAELATLFRSQYIITLDSSIAGDGTEYAFTLQANTENGESNVAEGTLRAPIPVPIVRFDETAFAEAISSPTTILPIILADQEIASITATIDGEAVEVSENAVLIDPAQFPPASYTLAVTATDVDGDSGTGEISFETAPLPPSVSLNDLPTGAITEPTTITLDVQSQTTVSSASYTIGDQTGESSDAEAGFPLTIDPILLPVGDYELSINVSNEGGASSTVTAPISIGETAPRNIRIDGADSEITEATELSIAADTQAGTEISSVSISANGVALEGTSIDPLAFPAGELSLEITVTDSNGQSSTETVPVTIGAVAPRVVIGEVPLEITDSTTASVTIQAQGNTTGSYSIDNGVEQELTGEIVIDGNELGNGEHTITITVTDENGMTTTETIVFNVSLPPTATPTPNASETAQAELDAQATSDAIATTVPQTEIAATEVQETSVAQQEQLNANATRVFNDEATRNAQSTLDAQPSATPTDEPTATDEPSSTPTDEATATDEPTATDAATATDEATATTEEEETEVAVVSTDASEDETSAPSSTPTLSATPPENAATLTPIGEIIEVDSQTAPPTEGNLTTILIACGGGLLLLILLAIVFFGRQRRENKPQG
jgi:VWFA-related protein